MFLFYIFCGYLYYIVSLHLLKPFEEIRAYYKKRWADVALLPLFNFVTFFIRFAGIINSIKTPGSWKTDTLTEEKRAFRNKLRDDNEKIKGVFLAFSDLVNQDT
jgi:hypothetical protein